LVTRRTRRALREGQHRRRQIWVIPLTEPAKAFALVPTSAPQNGGQFSPDGRWVAYMSRETG